MPIRPENRARYPKDWPAISLRIRFERAGGRCECSGECGRDRCSPRCDAEHGKPHPVTGSTVILTTAHLDDPIEDVRDENLKAMCQACHLLYDMPRHQANRRASREAERRRVLDKAGQLAFETQIFGPAIGADPPAGPVEDQSPRRSASSRA